MGTFHTLEAPVSAGSLRKEFPHPKILGSLSNRPHKRIGDISHHLFSAHQAGIFWLPS